MFQTDTIAAIATALSDSGIGIIRISGSEAVKIVDNIFITKSGKKIMSQVESHTIHYGYICDETDKMIDEVMVAVMRAPRSYTTEDTVEINCHGGVLVLKKVLELVIKNGARMAEPGEFTKRAFLNGRIDLSKAEAVMDVIHSQNEYALKSSMNQLTGKLSKEIRQLREKLIYEIAFIESALDDPEHISLDGYPDELDKKIKDINEEIQNLLRTCDNGKLMKEGISTVIVGKPNAGKSSLMNILLGKERAIVTEIAGTTRDVLSETINLHGITLNIIDTAGIRNTEDVVEKIGVERAKEYAAEADLIIYVVDSSVKLDENDRDISRLLKDKRGIILLNKSDLDQKVKEEDILSLIYDKQESDEEVLNNICIISTSTKKGIGIDELENTIQNMFFEGKIDYNNEIIITNSRHKEALQNAYQSLCMVMQSIQDDMPEDFYSIDLMSAYTSLGKIIGEEIEDDLVQEIFSKFCMGK